MCCRNINSEIEDYFVFFASVSLSSTRYSVHDIYAQRSVWLREPRKKTSVVRSKKLVLFFVKERR